MQNPKDSPMIALVNGWATRFGYYDGRIDLTVGDLASFTTPDCTLTAHAPLWRTKPGEEKPVPAGDVRKQLARMLKISRVARHNMHLAIHPDGEALCLFFEVRGKLAFLPFTLIRVPLAFVVQAVETDGGLRINEVHERPAANPQEAKQALIHHHEWPGDTVLQPYVNFGAIS